MAKRKTKSSIGLELTGDRVNLVRLDKTPEGIVLTEARSVKLPLGKKGDEKRLLASGIIKAFEGLDFTKDEIALGVGGHMSFVRKVKLPPVSRSKLKQVVTFEVQQQVPFSLNEVIWNYQVISPISKTPGPVVVLIAAIKQSFVEDLLKVLQSSINKVPEFVDISSLALHNNLIFNNSLPKEKVGILVNLGFSYTDVSIESKGDMAFTRAVPIGRKNLLKKIAESRGIEMEQAEEVLTSEDVSSVILPVWEDLLAEIKRTTNYYLSQVEKVTHFQYIYISGEIPFHSTLPSLLKNSFRTEVEEIDPFKKIGYDPAQLTDGASSFCVPTGLALRALADFPVEVNLLPAQVLSKRKLVSKNPYFISSFVVLFLTGWVLLVLGTRNYNLINEKISMVEPILKSYKPYVSKTEELKTERRNITSKLQNIEGILRQKSQLSEVLLEVSEFTPSNIYITEISAVGAGETTRSSRTSSRTTDERVTRGQPPRGEDVRREVSRPTRSSQQESSSQRISLSGITDSYPMVDEYIKQLSTSPLFKSVELISVKSTTEGTTRTTQPRAERRDRTGGRREEIVVEKEEVQFVLEIGL